MLFWNLQLCHAERGRMPESKHPISADISENAPGFLFVVCQKSR
jgi:hypothetical protein